MQKYTINVEEADGFIVDSFEIFCDSRSSLRVEIEAGGAKIGLLTAHKYEEAPFNDVCVRCGGRARTIVHKQ